MYLSDGHLVLSPSDVVNHLACEHLTQLNLLVTRGEAEKPTASRSEVELIQRLGDEHELAYLAQLKASDLRVVEVAAAEQGIDGLRQAHADTLAAMHEGADVIFQATFFDGTWRGHADFLLRTPPGSPTTLGDYGYEPYDTKLARTAKVSALVQLADYATHLEAIQGVRPKRVHIVLGNRQITSFATHDVAAFHRRARTRLLAATEPSGRAAGQPRPIPIR